jgi:membrane protein implicated in regulation of membrane protease activity
LVGAALPLLGLEFKILSLVVLVVALAWLTRRMSAGVSGKVTTSR